MNLLLALQVATQGWVGPTVALSLVIIAACSVLITTTIVAAAKAGGALTREIAELRREIEPTLKAVGRLAEKGAALSEQVSGEVREILETSRRTRFSFERGVKQAKRRLQDLDALVEVVQEEVEETALDVSAAARRIRTAGGAIGLVRRLLVRGRR